MEGFEDLIFADPCIIFYLKSQSILWVLLLALYFIQKACLFFGYY
jgi:hypothetical protein